jgi:hypothetical protein
VLEVVRAGRESCFTHGALVRPVELRITLALNGEDVAQPSTEPYADADGLA